LFIKNGEVAFINMTFSCSRAQFSPLSCTDLMAWLVLLTRVSSCTSQPCNV